VIIYAPTKGTGEESVRHSPKQFRSGGRADVLHIVHGGLMLSALDVAHAPIGAARRTQRDHDWAAATLRRGGRAPPVE